VETPVPISDEFLGFLLSCLEKDPEKRIKWKSILKLKVFSKPFNSRNAREEFEENLEDRISNYIQMESKTEPAVSQKKKENINSFINDCTGNKWSKRDLYILDEIFLFRSRIGLINYLSLKLEQGMEIISEKFKMGSNLVNRIQFILILFQDMHYR
jgi:hypothetical protein